MLKVICINGISYAGKDSFINNLENRISSDQVIRISTIDPIKELYADFFKWDWNKTPEDRKNLNMLKNIWKESCNGPIEYCKGYMDMTSKGFQYLFIMVREFEEMLSIKKLANDLGHKGYTLQVIRNISNIPPVEQEFLDSHPKDFRYDITINNPTVGTYPDLPELRKAVEDFLLITKYEMLREEFK